MTDIKAILENYGRIEYENGYIFVIIPFFFLGNDEGICLRIGRSKDGMPIFSDGHSTMDYLDMEGVEVKDYQEKIDEILKRYDMILDGRVLRKRVHHDDEFTIRRSLGYFIQGMTLIANVHTLAISQSKKLFSILSDTSDEQKCDKNDGSCENVAVNVLESYSKGLDLLDRYDHQTLKKPLGRTATYKLTYDECRKMIDSMSFGDSSDVFGVEKGEGKLEGILKNVEQEVFGEELFSTIEEKSAHLLYYLIKDHPFVDGCKRISATLFLEYLNKNNALMRKGKLIISNETLAAMTILIAESRADEKDAMIKLIMNFLKG